MRLKTLELKGFKSFANDTVIQFDEDVIGVVGPNGSGKSNIVDAIRWVLGEQKGKELRLEHMGDVIFNGTKKRKAANAAQVSITFENTDNLLPTEYNNVTITRILYRSGESEYRLNGVTCRLKDITSLFVDTGIGSNSYAIIALGMVDDILHNKENARRRMFEQAAGISKYKRRKHETLLKLKSTSADLDRVEDLLYEIEGNLKMLEKQARRAKRYRDLKDKYKEMAIDLAIRKSSDLHNRHKELSKQVDTEKELLTQLDADLNKTEAKLQQFKKDHLEEEQAVGSKQRELNILVGQIRSLENDKNLKEQETSFLQQSVKKLQVQVNQNLGILERLKNELHDNSEKLKEAIQLSEEKKSDLDQAHERRVVVEKEYSQARERRETAGSAKQDLEEAYIDMERSLSSQNARAAEMAAALNTTDSEMEQVKEELKARNNDLSQLERRLSQLNKELESKLLGETRRKEQLQAAHASREKIREEMRARQRKLDACKHERDLLRDMIQKLEGYPESIKFLSKSKQWQAEAPLLSDVIYCEPEYRPIVEHVLTPYLNDFVVQTLEEAAQAVSLLANSQKGKANLFVLDRVSELNVAPLKTLPGARAVAGLVQCDDKYRPLINHLLGHVYITERSPLDQVYSAKEFRDCVLIDSTGSQIVHRTGMSGGSVGLFEGKKLGRVKHLERLEEEIHALDIEIDKLNEDLTSTELQIQLLESEEVVRDIDHRRQEIQALSSEQAHARALVGKLEETSQQLHNRKKNVGATLDQLKAEISLNVQKLGTIKRKMQQDVSQWEDADRQYADMIESYSREHEKFNNANLAYVEQKNFVDNLEKEIRYKGRRTQELQDTIISDNAQIEQELHSIGSIEKELQACQEQLIELYGKKKHQESALSEAEQLYFSARNTIHEMEEKIRNKMRERQNSEYLVNQLKDELTDIKFKLTSVSERLQIEFNVKLEEVLDREIDEDMPLDEAEDEVVKLRGRIENYGEINPMAVEAYDEMKERYETINTQKLDILEAKESLIETIREIEETATEKFLTAFDAVRTSFIDVFRSLFTEDDNCDLFLEDPDNPLESNIQIIAKPKGKRPKSLSQLSGGEKTLTAIALLFALYLLKPAPFCVFDEVDAPLDDANIQKFNRIIKNFSSNSQFVIVTHNKQTMAAVNIMYGVYMEEQGISNLSPVDFRFLDDKLVLESATA